MDHAGDACHRMSCGSAAQTLFRCYGPCMLCTDEIAQLGKHTPVRLNGTGRKLSVTANACIDSGGVHSRCCQSLLLHGTPWSHPIGKQSAARGGVNVTALPCMCRWSSSGSEPHECRRAPYMVHSSICGELASWPRRPA